MENEKTMYSQYTEEELSELDGGTIADLLWEEWKYRDCKPKSLREHILDYESKHSMDNL